ncbi:unnamed protein product, partial [marine sediment metagenome]
SPANNTINTTDNTPDFTFNITDNLASTLDCTLWLDNGTEIAYGNNASVLNTTSTTITANTSLANNDYWWWINCSDGVNTNISEKRNISINVEGEIYYVRPAGGNYGGENGSSYENAWDGLENVVWGSGGVGAGDTLYVCGLHLRTWDGIGDHVAFRASSTIEVQSGASGSVVTIRGDYSGDPGEIWTPYIFSHEAWVDEGSNVYSITLPTANHGSDWYFEDVAAGGSFVLLDPVADLETCQSTAGSHYAASYTSGNTLYVHT